jgi:hypothetical protein
MKNFDFQRASLVAFCLMALHPVDVIAAQFLISGQVGSGEFGRHVYVLPNGNILVTDPEFDAPGPVVDVGAVYLYRPDGTLISALRGSVSGDRVGASGATVLSDGDYVFASPYWDNGSLIDAGAVTFGSGVSGVSGVVSASNSLVGSATSDQLGNSGITALSNGNYVVISSSWNKLAGAVTFGAGAGGITGVVSASNSLVGRVGDRVGFFGVVGLTNGNYVVLSPVWSNGTNTNLGAVTFGSGISGIAGEVTAGNSLVGRMAVDGVGRQVTALGNGNYVVTSPSWDNGRGAVTFGSGASGTVGEVSALNSLVGSAPGDSVGDFGVTKLFNNNYVITSVSWNRGAGAVTFGSGVNGVAGAVSVRNSLVGTRNFDRVGFPGVTALSNGNYVVASTYWNNSVGAATFGSGVDGIAGEVSASNSLVGSAENDYVGISVTALSNGNYVVRSPSWSNGPLMNVGAVTFGSGIIGVVGELSVNNSLVGISVDDQIGSHGVTALSNGNYVVRSSIWDNEKVMDAGAVTFSSGVSGIIGVVTRRNSLIGISADDRIGSSGVTALSNGNYVVRSGYWDYGSVDDAGAVTLGFGDYGIVGAVSPANSLVGSTESDGVGNLNSVARLSNGNYVAVSNGWDNGAVINAGAVTFGSGVTGVTGLVTTNNSTVGSTARDFIGEAIALSNGNYLVRSDSWDNGAVIDAGAITLALADGSVTGPINSDHSVLGLVASGGGTQVFDYDPLRNQLVVGQRLSNRVVLQRTGAETLISVVETLKPSVVNEPVRFTANVTSTTAPDTGQVTFRADSGESCVDVKPSAVSGVNASFSCSIMFGEAGKASVIAEYTGSVLHAYSGSAPVVHEVVSESTFSSGFETL